MNSNGKLILPTRKLWRPTRRSLILGAAAAALMSRPALAALSILQTKNIINNSASGTTQAFALNSVITAGSIIVVAGICNAQPALTTVSWADNNSNAGVDSNLNSLASGNMPYDNGSASLFMGAVFNTTAGSQTVTMTLSAGASLSSIEGQIYEVAGYARATCAWDKINFGVAVSANMASGSSGTLSQANEFAVGHGHCYAGITATGSGWTADSTPAYLSGTSVALSQLTSATTAINATATDNNGALSQFMAIGTISGTLSGGSTCPTTRALTHAGC